jgi:hypothetical protein
MPGLTQSQVAILERLVSRGFTMVAFPLYANAVGVRKGEYAALLEPLAGGGFRLFGEPCVLLDGNPSVRVTREGRNWFVWKNKRLEATPDRMANLNAFVAELTSWLDPRV